MSISKIATLTSPAILAAVGLAACQPAANTNAANTTTPINATATTPSANGDITTSSSTTTTTAPAEGPVPAAYRGVWAQYAMSCGSEGHSGRFTITATTVHTRFNDLYTVTGVEQRGSGILIRGTRTDPRYGQVDETFNFTPSPNGLTYTDSNNIETVYTLCPAANG